MGLTKMQKAFVAAYVADPRGNATQAAITAGYSQRRAKSAGCELMKNHEIRESIERQTAKQLDKASLKNPVTREKVLEYIVGIVERALDSGDGGWQASTVLKGAELLGRHLGMFTEKIEVGLDAKLLERIDQARRRVGLDPVYDAQPELQP